MAVDVDGRSLSLSNLAKVLYPATGTTKAQVIEHYARVTPVLLPHLRGRPLTLKRYPNGVDGHSFFEKNAPRSTPDWVRTARLPAPGSTKSREEIDYVVAEEPGTLAWTANLAALELHTPMWRVDDEGAALDPDLLVVDLDPGPPATVVECCRVAEAVQVQLARDGLSGVAKTSGSKGLQVYAPVRGATGAETREYARRRLAEALEAAAPDAVVSRMTKALRPGKVLVDWSQNNPAKTTVSVYSLRARERPTVSTPVEWDEVADCRAPEQLVFDVDDVARRLQERGDLFAGVLDGATRLPGAGRP